MTRIAYAMLALLLTSAALAAPADAVVRKHWMVSGQVQGVGFRAFAYEAARDLKLRGWVRNLNDGRVEVVAEGAEKAIRDLLERVRQGPRGSKVKGVAGAKVDEKEKLGPEFEIRDTAEPPAP